MRHERIKYLRILEIESLVVYLIKRKKMKMKATNPQLFINIETPVSILNNIITATLNHQLMMWVTEDGSITYETELMDIVGVKYHGKPIYTPGGEFTSEHRAYEEFVKSMIRFGIDIDGELSKVESWLDFQEVTYDYLQHFQKIVTFNSSNQPLSE